jgi:hypothetical protein
MLTGKFSARYTAAMAVCAANAAPISAGVFGRLADHERSHG